MPALSDGTSCLNYLTVNRIQCDFAFVHNNFSCSIFLVPFLCIERTLASRRKLCRTTVGMFDYEEIKPAHGITFPFP